MARRRGKPGEYLMTDDYTGVTRYSSELKRDYWGSYAKHPLIRNLQEIAKPFNDPQPVPMFRGPDYEYTPPCVGEVSPIYIGLTTVPTRNNNAASYALDLSPSIPNMAVGCTFEVR